MSDKQWKFPVGTQREWSTGVVVKTHDNTIFDDIQPAWIPLPFIPHHFQQIFKNCDQLGRKIFNYKDPVEGELWLDKEFEKFETSTGKKFSAADFKQYARTGKGTYGYQFFTELCRRYTQDKLDLNERIATSLVEANEDKRNRLRSLGEIVKKDGVILTKDEIKLIKEKVQSEYKESDYTDRLTIEDTQEIESTLKNVLTHLERGENFDGEKKLIYEKAKVLLLELEEGKYRSIVEVKKDITNMLSLMNSTFADNWGIRESYRKKVATALDKYVSRYKPEIEQEELENFNNLLGISLYSPVDEFYTALKKSPLFGKIDVFDKKYIGAIIQSPYNGDSKYEDFILESVKDLKEVFQSEFKVGKHRVEITYSDNTGKWTRDLAIDELQELIRSKQTGVSSLDIPMKLRFQELYNKRLSGEWTERDITLLETTEKLTHYLPDGHLKTNLDIDKIRKEDSWSGDNSYAHYAGDNREIYFSSNAIKPSDIGITDLNSGGEIASVLIHEVGHAVSTKLGRRKSKEYREFVVQCGWSWEQFQIGNRSRNFIATGEDKDLKREGSKSEVPLITSYAAKSPEEAFAENYSFYTQYKHEIDSFLKGDVKALEKYESLEKKDSNKKYSNFIKDLPTHIETRTRIEATLKNEERIEGSTKTDLIDPYNDTLETRKEKDVNQRLIITEKKPNSNYSDNYQTPQPVFTVFDQFTGVHDIINTNEIKDAEIHFANKYLRRVSPTFSISKDCFNLLLSKGFTTSEIRDYTLNSCRDKPIPEVRTIVHNAPSSFKGLRYRGEVIPASKLEKMNGIFKAMKKIWESDELKKALIELGLDKYHNLINSKMDNIEKAQLSDIFTFFADAKQKIKDVVEGKKGKQRYADCIIRNYKGEVLLLERGTTDDFMPGKWCLPGGKVEEGEDFLQGATRELLEETGIDLTGKLSYIETIQKLDCTIGYFEGQAPEPFFQILDNSEHYRYQFVPFDKLDNYELICDLGTYLKQVILTLPQPPEFTQLEMKNSIDYLFKKKEEVSKMFDDDKISSERWSELNNMIKSHTLEVVKKGFDNDLISQEQYLQALKRYK